MDKSEFSTTSIYRRGATRGAWFGLYLTTLVMGMLYSLEVPALSLLTLLLIAGVPFVIYRCLRHTAAQLPVMPQYSALWLEGIALFFFGGLIMTAVVAIWLTALDPTLVHKHAHTVVDIYRQTPGETAAEMAQLIEAAIEQNAIPSPIRLATSLLWATVFTGSILSMLMALLVRIKGK